jgi:HEPN domain-containing protein
MNALTAEWVEKAEGDYTTAERETRARKRPNYDAACFHAQQCAEKYLKAFLQEYSTSFPKTHSLIDLLQLVLSQDASFELQRDLLIRLERYAVRYRYPGEMADKEEAQSALRAAKTVRMFLRQKLGFTANQD